ncbi:MAG TPA: 50S ribosomal protein P1 [Nitrososphaera sp.]|nr:50S ribosomal protein P1 [Nitrososphaera sp.]
MQSTMEYVYAALLLHKLKQNITEDGVKNVVKAAGVAPDDVRVKALVAALSEVNIEEALKAAPVAVAAAPAAGGAGPSGGAAKAEAEEKKDEKKEEEALEGLSSLFG